MANRSQFVYRLLELLERPRRQDREGGKGLLADAGVCQGIMGDGLVHVCSWPFRSSGQPVSWVGGISAKCGVSIAILYSCR